MRRYFLPMPTIVLLAAAPVKAQLPAAIPDTPAGRFVSTWLNAYNSADPKELQRNNALYGRKSPPQVWIDMHPTTGRLTPMRVEACNSNELTVLFSAEIGDAFWQNVVKIDPVNPMKVVNAGFGTAA